MGRGSMALATTDIRERLIEAVRARPVLYDTGHEHHRDVDVRERCWAAIATDLGVSSATLKREWKILRDSLRQALRKTGSGATTKAGAPCKRWRFQHKMNFLVPYMTRREKHTVEGITISVNSMKSERASEVEELEGETGVSAGMVGRGEGDPSLELFFASVCAAARRLPRTRARTLQQDVLAALARAEADDDSKMEVYDDSF